MLTILFTLLVGCDTAPTDSAFTQGCLDPTPILNRAGESSGYLQCSDGSRIRVASVPIEIDLYAQDLAPCDPPTPDAEQECYEHTDCGADGLSFCVCQHSDWSDFNRCVDACENDDDCGDGSICVAPEQGGSHLGVPRCKASSCMSPEDCEGGECGATWVSGDNSAYFATACRSAQDICRTNDECDAADVCWPWDPMGQQDDDVNWECFSVEFEE